MYFVLVPRILNMRNKEHGVWDAAKREDGGVRSFESVEDAKEYVVDNQLDQLTYYIVKLVG